MPLSKSNIKPTQCELPSIDVVVNFVDEFGQVGKAIKSLRKSRGVQVRILVIDDSGKDNSEFFSRLLNSDDLYKRSNRCGYINGLKLAKAFIESEFVGILNSDDISDKERLINQVTKLTTGLDVCVGRIVKFKWIPWFRLPSVSRSQNNGRYCPHLIYLGPLSTDASWVMRRETYGILFESKFNSDWGIALDNFNKLRVGIDLKSKYYYRQHSKQITRDSPLLFTSECEFIQKSLTKNFNLKVEKSFIVALATSWKLDAHVAIDLFEDFTLELRKRHGSICFNSRSFDREVVRRLLIAVLNPNNSGWWLLKVKILLKFPLDSIRLFSAIGITLLLGTGRKS
jgi:hypothetical protein